MIRTRARPTADARAALLVGAAAAFVAAVDLARWIRPGTLLDSEPGWLLPRLALGLCLAAATAAAGLIAGAAFFSAARTRLLSAPLPALGLPAAAIAAIAAGAFVAGVALRIAAAAAVDVPFLEDEVNLVGPSLELTGTARDFADAIRPIPQGRPDPHEMTGVAYLRLLRACLRLAGTTVFGIRLPSLLGGCLSLVTAFFLARALLPAGGGALAVLVLAGLRWHLILSLTGWQSVLLAPLLDVAALLLLRARRRASALAAAVGGIAAGLGAHLYLSAWVGGAGLLLFAAWPTEGGELVRRRLGRAALFAAGFALAAAPLFLLREGRRISYFGRASRHSVVREMEIAGSPLPLLAAGADGLVSPWLLPDPEGRHDLHGARRLPWIVGVPLAVALGRALLSARKDLSALLLAQAAAALAGAVASGQAGHPNGFRFGYLTTLTAVAAAAGTLAILGLAPPGARRNAAVCAVGLLILAGAQGFVEAAVLWPRHRATFDSFHGEDTLLGRTAARWESQGEVRVTPGLGRNDRTIETVRRGRLSLAPLPAAVPGAGRSFRIEAPGARPERQERVVERVRDGWGREWAVVLGQRGRP